jgi:acetylornithine deacetylase
MDADRLRADLDGLLQFASIGGTPAESEVQTWLAERFAADGLDVEVRTEAVRTTDSQFPGMEVPRESITTVIGRRVGSRPGPTVLLCGHTDVVPPGVGWTHPPFEPTWLDGPRGARVVARGACDMKAGLAAAWAAVRELQDVDLCGEIVLLPVSAEEDGGAGSFHAIRSGVQADMSIIPEPTDLALVPANAGALTFRLTVPGAAVHASRRTEGVSAIDNFWPIVQALHALETKRNTDVDPLMKRWSVAYPLSIGQLHAGNWASSVPDLLIAEGRYGVALGESVDDAKAELHECVVQACADDPWLRDHPVQVDWWGGQFAPGKTPIDHPLIRALGDAHQTVIGDRADVYGAPYGSDLRLWHNLAGVPTVQYGPGDSAVAHGPDEYVDFSDVVNCAHVLREFLLRTCI